LIHSNGRVDRSHQNWSVLAVDYWHRVRDAEPANKHPKQDQQTKIPNTQSNKCIGPMDQNNKPPALARDWSIIVASSGALL